jgi:hypothetical protein
MIHRKVCSNKKTALGIMGAVFCFMTAWSQENLILPRNNFRFEVGLLTAWHPLRPVNYPSARLNMKLHDSPSPECYFLGSFPIGKKGFGVELSASAGLLFGRESFTIDSVYVNNTWTTDRFRQNPLGKTFYGRFALLGFWEKHIPGTPLKLGFSAGVGTSLYMPAKFTGLGVDYSLSPNPVDITLIHEVRINTPDGGPHLFVPLILKVAYLFKNQNALTLSFRGGFSHQDLIRSRYVYSRNSEGYVEIFDARVRDISFGVGLGFSFAAKKRRSAGTKSR